MRHRLQWFIHHIQTHGLRNGDKHPAYSLLVGYGTLPTVGIGDTDSH